MFRSSFWGTRGREKSLRPEVKDPRDDLRHSNSLCGIPLWEAEGRLQVESVYCRLHIDVE